jgi:hypothetical protein
MLRVAGSLKLGKVIALEIMRVLQKGGSLLRWARRWVSWAG